MAKLLIQESAGVREFELVDDEVRIGRELDNTLRLSDPSISRHHAVMRRTAVGYEVQDLGSSNGVLVNGARVQSSPLTDSDRVTLGQIHITFVDPRPVEESPLGTVRYDAGEMAKMHVGEPMETEPVPTLLPKAPVPSRPVPPPPPPEAASTAKSQAGEPELPPEIEVMPPGSVFEEEDQNPAPAFLRSWLPPIPDEAEPLMLGGAPERGDFVTRLLAALIDAVPMVAVMMVFILVQFLLGMVLSGAAGGCLMTLLSVLEMIVMLVYQLVFMPWCWSKFGATPGKKIMKLRVVPEDDPAGRIEMSTAFLRAVGHILNFGFGYLLIFGAERKGVQDILSKTICIKVDR
jgi:pSer/pThr/pTyr-binding forkhead associated (FHA) protein/uncharacterized RDD family membrane protein YckC